MVAELGAPGSDAAGLSDVGAVTGATAPEQLEALRAQMPARRLPAARGRRPGGQRPRPGAGVRARPRRRPGLGLARDRLRLRERRRRRSRRARARARRRACASSPGACTREPAASPLQRHACEASGPRLYDRRLGWWRKIARFLAPIALAAVAVGVYLIVHATVGHQHHRPPTQSSTTIANGRRHSQRKHRRRAEVLRRQVGRHAERDRQDDGRLDRAADRALNPSWPRPNSLQTGQRLRLRR